MNNNPFINALFATTYITVIVSVIFYTPQMNIPENTIMIPIAMLSLLVLSVAMMGYFFVYQPVQLLIEGKQKEATKLFLSTVAIFACITAVMVSIWLLLIPVL